MTSCWCGRSRTSQTVSYSATVTGALGGAAPTGTVTFTAGSTVLCSATLTAATASCPATTAPVGSDTVTATYSGDTDYSGSTGTVTETIGRAAGTVGIAASPAGTTFGQTVTYSAAVTGTAGAAVPTGTVRFSIRSLVLCTATLSAGSGSCQARNARVGTDTVVATYSGDTDYSGFTAALTEKVAPPPMTGYRVVTSGGRVYSFGSSVSYGSIGGVRLAAPVVGLAPTADGKGYWLVASDGGIFTFGDAHFYGSTGSSHLAAPVVGMAVGPDGHGYSLAAADGVVFTFGDAPYLGSVATGGLASPIAGINAG